MQVFNSGVGGYTCDNCQVLLWAGHAIRHYIYGTTKEQVVPSECGEYFYCSERCRLEDKLLTMLDDLNEDVST